MTKTELTDRLCKMMAIAETIGGMRGSGDVQNKRRLLAMLAEQFVMDLEVGGWVTSKAEVGHGDTE